MAVVTTKPTYEAIEIIDKILSIYFYCKKYTTLIKKDGLHYVLNRQYSIGETSDLRGAYTLWNFPVKDSLTDVVNRNPIYFALSVKLKENEEIEELNIKLFKEDKSKTKESSLIPTELLLRVEWSNIPQESHAQPHWHIHSYTIVDHLEGLSHEKKEILKDLIADEQKLTSSMFQEMKESSGLEIAEKSNGQQKEFQTFKFHLAMLADWHKADGNPHNNILTNEILSIWLPQCLRYIKEQIEYILEKMN